MTLAWKQATLESAVVYNQFLTERRKDGEHTVGPLRAKCIQSQGLSLTLTLGLSYM